MTSREHFEAWAPNYCWKYSTTKELAWLAWQASREAVEIQLPDRRDYEETLSDHELGFNAGLELCAEAILAAGIKVKGE
ncbi:hypothetical protein VU677_06650 [Hafnia paralvei]|uniref:hypothetical protein n=1 Tax=Hafnia paralvei TaxID=546367 RepID=UPI003CEDD6FB